MCVCVCVCVCVLYAGKDVVLPVDPSLSSTIIATLPSLTVNQVLSTAPGYLWLTLRASLVAAQNDNGSSHLDSSLFNLCSRLSCSKLNHKGASGGYHGSYVSNGSAVKRSGRHTLAPI